MIGSLSRRLITWFGGSYLHNERLVATDASHNVSLDEAKPSTFTTDWDSIGYPNFGHWRESCAAGIYLCDAEETFSNQWREEWEVSASGRQRTCFACCL